MSTSTPYDFNMNQYPFMFQRSNGKVLYAGEEHHPFVTVRTKELSTIGEGSWNDVVTLPDAILGSSAVMYGVDKIIKGGGSDAMDTVQWTDQVYRLDATASSPEWQQIDSFNHERTHFHLVVLPDRSVLAVGGVIEHETVAVLEPELLKKPDESTVNSVHLDQIWQDMAPLAHVRQFHSTALLLPDARVLVAGTDPLGVPGSPAYSDAQVFSPPYLFGPGGTAAARPEIGEVTSACISNVVYYGGTFTIATPQASSVTQVNLIRPGSSTHSFDQDQRLVPVTFSPNGSNTLTANSPTSGNVAPPGYYMLFIVDGAGVPSVAKWVRLEAFTSANDCNGNFKHDLCDIEDGTSQDCDQDNLPDDSPACYPSIGPTKALSSDPPCMLSLWRSENNVIRQTFACNLTTVPTPGQIRIHKMLQNGAYGPDLSNNFAYSIDPANPRTLEIKEVGSTLEHRQWYAILTSDCSEPPGSMWSEVEPMFLQYVVQRGDASKDGRVLARDASMVNACNPCPDVPCPCFPEPCDWVCDERRDMNGDDRIVGADVSIVNAHIPSAPVAKPKGHGGEACTGACPPLP